jgi:hypothetical protein
MYRKEPKGYNAKQMNVLAALISGIVGSGRTNYPQIASKTPDLTQLESRVKRISRFINEVNEEQAIHWLPFAAELLANLSSFTLVLMMDGSEVGRGCLALMLSVQYRGRALPLGWLVVKGKKGHFAQEKHIELVSAVKKMIPKGADVIFLGDGEFDGVQLLAKLAEFGWKYACRTAKNAVLYDDEEEISFQDLILQPGMCLALEEIAFTRQQYGPILAVAWWRRDYQEPIYLVSNMDLVEEVCGWYKKRFRIETFFSDQKSRGFHLHKSHLADPKRLAKLMIAACLAYIWIVYLGNQATQSRYLPMIHRTDRCDLSLFQLGLRLLEYLLDFDLPIPVSFLELSLDNSHFVR